MSGNQCSSETVQVIRRRRWAGALLCAWTGIAAACGGSEEVVRAPKAAKVVWGGEGGADAPAADEAPAEAAPEAEAPAQKSKEPEAAPKPSVDSEEEAALAAGAIDLDAPSAPPARAEEATPVEEKATARKGRKSKRELRREAKERAAKERAAKAAAAPVAAEEKSEEKETPPEAPKAEPAPDAPPPLAELQRRRNQREKDEAKNEKASPKEDAAEPAPAPAKAEYKGAEPCRASSFTIARVRTACENGGRPGAKRVMKEAINKAVATGQLLKCGDCHSNTSDYSLKSDAVGKLQDWLDK